MTLLTLFLLIHYFYSNSCCGGKDCHPVPCSEITMIGGDFLWQHGALRIRFDHRVMQVSEDGECHVCVTSEEFTSRGVCIYLPAQT